MEHFDYQTLSFIIGGLKLLTGLLTLVAKKQAPDVPGPGQWAIGSFISAGAFFLLSYFPLFGETVSYFLIGLFLLSGEAMNLAGIRKFNGKSSMIQLSMVLPLVSAISVFLVSLEVLDVRVRIILNSLCFATLLGWSAWEWWRQGEHGLRIPARITGAAFGIMTLVLLFRAGLGFSTTETENQASSPANIAMMLIGITCQIVVNYGFMLIVIGKIAEHRRKQIAMRDRILSVIAHDLRNPVANLIGFAEMLDDECERQGTADPSLVAHILISAKQTDDLLAGLLEWGAAQQAMGVFRPCPTPIGELVEQEIAKVKETGERKNVSISLVRDDAPVVDADPYMIGTVVRNLMTNAIKFTHPGGHVSVTIHTLVENIEIAVEDNGVGIQETALANLFNPERPTSTHGTEDEHGNGLGLLLFKDFVDRHGGRMTVSSEPGVGSRFAFRIPRSRRPSHVRTPELSLPL